MKSGDQVVFSLTSADIFSVKAVVLLVFVALVLLFVYRLIYRRSSVVDPEVFDVEHNWDKIKDELRGRYSAMAEIVANDKFDIVAVESVERTDLGEVDAGEAEPPAQGAAAQSSGDGSAQAGSVPPASTPGGARQLKATKLTRLTITEKMLYTDIVIEKAQKNLTIRSKSYYQNGIKLYSIALMIIFSFALYLNYSTEFNGILHRAMGLFGFVDKDFVSDEIKLFGVVKGEPIYIYMLVLLKRIVSGGAILGGAYVIAATANSCFRESTILLHRRHLLRYVRLLSYEQQGNIDTKDLRDVFGVDDATKTGFDKIRTETLKDNLVGKLLDALGGVLQQFKGKGGDKEVDSVPKKGSSSG